MRRRQLFPRLASLLLVSLAWRQAVAQAVLELAGARFEPFTTVAGSRLLLNGAGIRYKAIFKVYAAGL